MGIDWSRGSVVVRYKEGTGPYLVDRSRLANTDSSESSQPIRLIFRQHVSEN